MGDRPTPRLGLLAWVHEQACSMPQMPHPNPDDSKCASIVRRVVASAAPPTLDVENLRNLLDSPPPYRADYIDWMSAKEAHALGWSEAIAKVREYARLSTEDPTNA